MSKIAVTGAAGYIGSVLVGELLKEGHKVVAIDNFRYRQTSLLYCTYDTKLTVVRGDVRDEKIIRRHLSENEFIIPLAAIVGAPACDKNEVAARTTNLEAIQLLIATRDPQQKIIFPNTNSGYGIGSGHTVCDETSPLKPLSFYGRLKVEAEQKLLKSENVISLRLATVFGTSPRMRLDLLVNEFVYKALKDKYIVLFEAHNKRNYIHIRDVARVFIHAMKNFERMKNETYNVGLSTANLNKIELCELIKQHIPAFVYFESEIESDPDKRDYMVSNEKIEKTGFKPIFSVDDGIKELIKGYQMLTNGKWTNVI